MPRIIGLMSGSSLDGLDIACIDFSFDQHWRFDFLHAETVPYSSEWIDRLSSATQLNARDFLLLHTSFGHFLGQCVNDFLQRFHLSSETIDLIASHGHTVFHEPSNRMTSQIGDGAAIAAETGLMVLTDLRSMDVALGGQGAPIVPIGEKYLFSNYRLLLNIGGITNISEQQCRIAFDICPANRIMNQLMKDFCHKEFDRDGELASKGKVDSALFDQLNQFDYYGKIYPKSLSNSFGLDQIYPLIISKNLSIEDSLRTYLEHIVEQISRSISMIIKHQNYSSEIYENCKLLVTGGGAHNRYLIERLSEKLKRDFGILLECPNDEVIDFKEALIMAFIGLLRMEKQPNVLSSVTGAKKDSIGGALWSN